MWLSHGSESAPEQDNEIACQVIWFENSSHLWTGVWANKPRVCQDSFFFKLLCSLHLPLQDMSDNVSSTEQKMEGAQVPGSGFSPTPDSPTFLRCSELSQRKAQSLRRSRATSVPPRRWRCCRWIGQHVFLQRCAGQTFGSWLCMRSTLTLAMIHNLSETQFSYLRSIDNSAQFIGLWD